MQCKVLTDSYMYISTIKDNTRTTDKYLKHIQDHGFKLYSPQLYRYLYLHCQQGISFQCFCSAEEMHIAHCEYNIWTNRRHIDAYKCGCCAEKLGMKGTSRSHCNEHCDGRLRDDRLDFLNVTIWMFPTNYALSPQLDMLLCMRILRCA